MTNTSWLFVVIPFDVGFFLAFRLEGLHCSKSFQQHVGCIAHVIVHIFVAAERCLFKCERSKHKIQISCSVSKQESLILVLPQQLNIDNMVRERLEAMALKRREAILYHYGLEVIGQEGTKPPQSILKNDC